MGLQVHGKPEKLFSTSWQKKELWAVLYPYYHYYYYYYYYYYWLSRVTDSVECRRQVTAKGSPDVALSWIFDLQLGMARLFGQLCSAALDSRKGNQPHNS